VVDWVTIGKKSEKGLQMLSLGRDGISAKHATQW
jgi:hypothetical protein